MKTIIFVCTGNTCRSPMAEYILKHKILQLNLQDEYTAGSYGVCPIIGEPIAENAVAVLDENLQAFADYAVHKAQMIDIKEINKAYLILCMSDYQLSIVTSLGEPCKKRSRLFAKGISDPYGKNIDAYRSCYSQMEEEIENIVQKYILNNLDPETEFKPENCYNGDDEND